MAKTKITYIINSLAIGGTEKVLIDNINSLDFNKYEVIIISLSLFDPNNNIFNVIQVNPNVRIFYFEFCSYHNYSIVGYFKLLFKSKQSFKVVDLINDVVHDFKPNIIHFHTSPRELVIRKFLNYRVKYVFTDHTLRNNNNEYGFIKSKALALIFRKLYSGFNVITVSEQIKNSLYENNVINKKRKILTILNCVNIDDFNNLNSNRIVDELNAIYVSRVENNKGHDDLIKAWALLKDISKKHLYIVGPDCLSGKMQDLAKKLDCWESITFTGPVLKPKEFLLKANIAVFPSYKEGLPLSLLEKMAMKLPVIVSDINELTTIITDGENGLTFKVGNSVDLSEKLRQLYLNPSLAAKLGENARKTVEVKYSSLKNSQILDQFYINLLN